MMIQKRADELKPGDVIPANTAYGQRVVVEVGPSQVNGGAVCVRMFDGSGLFPFVYEPGIIVNVESPDLTPAQLRAEELAELLRLAVIERSGYDNLPAWMTRADHLLAEIEPPEPPTLAELAQELFALRALANVHGVFADGRYPDAKQGVDAILDRARRCKVLP